MKCIENAQKNFTSHFLRCQQMFHGFFSLSPMSVVLPCFRSLPIVPFSGTETALSCQSETTIIRIMDDGTCLHLTFTATATPNSLEYKQKPMSKGIIFFFVREEHFFLGQIEWLRIGNWAVILAWNYVNVSNFVAKLSLDKEFQAQCLAINAPIMISSIFNCFRRMKSIWVRFVFCPLIDSFLFYFHVQMPDWIRIVYHMQAKWIEISSR